MNDLEFRKAMMDLLIAEGAYVTDCGTNMDVNKIVIEKLRSKIKKHPKIWKRLFMVAW